MIEWLAWLSEKSADDCLFGGAISARESRESFNMVSHELRWNSFQSFQQFNRFAPFKSLEPPTRLKRFERLERGPSFYFGGTGTTVPQFLQVRSFSSLENFWYTCPAGSAR